MQQYIEWLKNYFSNKSKLPLSNDIENINYFEAAMVNSLGIVDLIETLESSFNITFDASHFQERRFSTIKGLAEIIHELKK